MLYLLTICQVNRKVFFKKRMNSVLVLLYTLSKCESKNCLNSSLKEMVPWSTSTRDSCQNRTAGIPRLACNGYHWVTHLYNSSGFFSSWLWDIKHLLKTKKSSFRIINLIFSASVTRVWFPLVRFIPEIYPLQQWQITLYSVSVCAGR